jgi:hypothetical protein
VGLVGLVGLALVVALAGCSSPDDPPTTAGSTPSKVAPRWERVASFTGTSDQRTAGFDIAAGALQWRVTASCTGSALRVSVDGEPEPLALPTCPGKGFGFSIRTGAATLDVVADGSWEVVVDQQLDTPVSEARLAGMDERSRVADGGFYAIDQTGSGTAALYRLPDGRTALRLDPFQVTDNSDLFVWLSEADRPRTSKDALEAPHVQLDRLKATAGAQNYLVPADVPTAGIRSVVIWCEPVRTAYAAASLGR